jgi:tRNA (cmo5U34)-methyltransferase
MHPELKTGSRRDLKRNFTMASPCDPKMPYNPVSYDAGIRRTLPYYDLFHIETMDLVRMVHPHPRVWVDTGCGTGSMVRSAVRVFPKTRFVLADPDPEMLLAVEAGIPPSNRKRVEMLPSTGSAGLSVYKGRLKANVVTAIQCHHYLSSGARLTAVKACRDLLAPGGLLVVFENIAPDTREGIRIGRKRWASFQMAHGKSRSEAAKHVGRYGKAFYPITLDAHLRLLRQVGFKTVELFWRSHLQAGFYAIK